MLLLFYILAALLIYFSIKSLLSGVAYLEFVRQELARSASGYTPFATIIAPCKGRDQGLRENLAALLVQDHPAYEVIFVVDDERDAAVTIISSLIHRQDAETQLSTTEAREHYSPEGRPDADVTLQLSTSATLWLGGEGSPTVKFVVAPKATVSSQKCKNLRAAVMHADERSEVFVFVDSDARPSKDWLRNLTAPLADEAVGAATGYRWFISEKPTLASELRSVWNASIASSLGPDENSNFCWGGSMAIRRETFELLDISGRWRTVVSDDFTVTRTMYEAGLAIRFVPQAMAATVENCSFRELMEFTTRQMKITRVYAPHLWKLSMFGSALFVGVMVAALAILVFSTTNDVAVGAAAFTLIAVSAMSIAKALLRLRAVRLALPQYEPALAKQVFSQLTLWAVTPAIFLWNTLSALASRSIKWRGVTYVLSSETETIVRNDV